MKNFLARSRVIVGRDAGAVVMGHEVRRTRRGNITLRRTTAIHRRARHDPRAARLKPAGGVRYRSGPRIRTARSP